MLFIWNKPSIGGPQISKKQLIAYLLIFIIAPIVTYTIGRWLDTILCFTPFPEFPLNLLLGFSVFFSGLAIGIKATRQLYHEGLGLPWGEVNSKVQSTKLVTTGLYAYTRNPMILGYSALPCGMGLMFQSPSMTVIIPSIIILINIGIVKFKEEPKLIERFGDDYKDYMKVTPLLIPKIKTVIKILLKIN